jgi:polyribonucleotide nucleotidyltransferase
VDPPEAEVGAIYPGKVVNITKFGAFVNILPGRDGLLHISKVGGGKRVDRVEDVLSLGQDLEVKVDDIDPQGKVSLSLAGDPPPSTGNGSAAGSAGSGGSASSGGSRSAGPSRSSEGSSSTTTAPVASFEAAFEAELVNELGDLGPGPAATGGGGDRGERGSHRGGDRGGDRGPRRPRRR